MITPRSPDQHCLRGTDPNFGQANHSSSSLSDDQLKGPPPTRLGVFFSKFSDFGNASGSKALRYVFKNFPVTVQLDD